ncbi:hypothetical protein M3Y97_00933700 [Aphelenchoides bicaudatus]|nr:hypothetical protein M3Y97_00933700 [Aphelenchoides bicaudatus]
MHFEHWASSTPLRKLLYEELCFQIGRSVFSNDFPKARFMRNVSPKYLKIAEQFIEQFGSNDIDQAKIKQAIGYIFEHFEQFEDNDLSNAYYTHEEDMQPSTSKLIGILGNELHRPKCVHSIARHAICFLFVEIGQSSETIPKFRMIRYYQEPLTIKMHLSKHKSLNDRPRVVSIAPNTQWSVRNSQQHARDLEDLCLLIKRRCPSVQINLLGFYTKSGNTLLDKFNSYLKEIERRNSDFVVYVSVDNLLSPSELSVATFKRQKHWLDGILHYYDTKTIGHIWN